MSHYKIGMLYRRSGEEEKPLRLTNIRPCDSREDCPAEDICEGEIMLGNRWVSCPYAGTEPVYIAVKTKLFEHIAKVKSCMK